MSAGMLRRRRRRTASFRADLTISYFDLKKSDGWRCVRGVLWSGRMASTPWARRG
jgi:hypothetical protein